MFCHNLEHRVHSISHRADEIEDIESDMVEDITFEAIDEDYDISSGEPEEEVIAPAPKNQAKSRNYREPKTDI